MNQYFTYILQCSDKTLYCGYTTDLEKRLATHNSGKGAKYTKTRLPVKLLASVDFDNKNDEKISLYSSKLYLIKAPLATINKPFCDVFSDIIKKYCMISLG